MCFEKIDTGKQPPDLFGCYLFDIFLFHGPGEFIFIKALVPHCETCIVPVKQFDQIPGFITEHKVSPVERIHLHIVLYKGSQTIYGLPHVSWAGAQIYGSVLNEGQHG